MSAHVVDDVVEPAVLGQQLEHRRSSDLQSDQREQQARQVVGEVVLVGHPVAAVLGEVVDRRARGLEPLDRLADLTPFSISLPSCSPLLQITTGTRDE